MCCISPEVGTSSTRSQTKRFDTVLNLWIQLLDHDEEIRDVDWSRDNSLLLSCSINGCVCLTSVEPTRVCRKWSANTRTTCCKSIHPTFIIRQQRHALQIPSLESEYADRGWGRQYLRLQLQHRSSSPKNHPHPFSHKLYHGFKSSKMDLCQKFVQKWCVLDRMCLWVTRLVC